MQLRRHATNTKTKNPLLVKAGYCRQLIPKNNA